MNYLQVYINILVYYLSAPWPSNIDDPGSLFLLQVVYKTALQCSCLCMNIKRISTTWQCQQQTVILVRLLRESAQNTWSSRLWHQAM